MICICVLVAVVWVGGLGQGLGRWVGGVKSEFVVSGFFVLMAGPGICILC